MRERKKRGREKKKRGKLTLELIDEKEKREMRGYERERVE